MSDHALEVSEDITDLARAPVAGLPVDPKTELAVIAVAIRSSWALHVAAPLLPIEAFTVPRHKRAWRAILALRKAGETPDVTTVAAWLRERKLLEAPDSNGAGGDEAFFAELLEHRAEEAQAEQYARKVALHHARRRVIIACHDAVRAVQQDPTPAAFAKAQRAVIEATSVTERKPTLATLRSAIISIAERFGNAAQALPVIPTGVKDLDRVLGGGWRRSHLNVVGARPGMGKSALVGGAVVEAAQSVLRWVDQDGIEGGEATAALVISAEMNREEVAARILAADARIPADRVLDGTAIGGADFAGGERDRLEKSAVRLASLPIWIDDKGRPGIDVIRSAVQRVKWECENVVREDGLPTRLRLLVVDHLHILDTGNEDTRNEALAEITGALKEMAKDEDMAVVLLAQLNRGCESRTNKRPVMMDLRDTGAIEQDADVILFVYREKYYDPETPIGDVAELIIAKRRGGAAGSQNEVAYTAFEGAFTMFRDLTKQEAEQLEREQLEGPPKAKRGYQPEDKYRPRGGR